MKRSSLNANGTRTVQTAVPESKTVVERNASPGAAAAPDPEGTERALRAFLGRKACVTVDRPLGSRHPEHPDIVYELNYGYVNGVPAGDGEWQDAYVWGVSKPVAVFEGEVVAVIHRLRDVEDKWVVAVPGTKLTREEVRVRTAFVERFFESVVIV